jgi:flagellar basal body-associated protein FliL
MRKRAFLIMLLPLVIILWVIGWSLLWTGSEPQSKTVITQAHRGDEIQIIATSPDEITVDNQ